MNGLADVFENFRYVSISNYKLDPCHYVGTPSFGWGAMLLKTGVILDANNLYGVSMSQKLPFSNFEWVYDVTEQMIREYDDNDIGHVLEVDLHYPK